MLQDELGWHYTTVLLEIKFTVTEKKKSTPQNHNVAVQEYKELKRCMTLKWMEPLHTPSEQPQILLLLCVIQQLLHGAHCVKVRVIFKVYK